MFQRRKEEAAVDRDHEREDKVGLGGEQGACSSHLMFVGALRDEFPANFLSVLSNFK